LQQLNNFQAVIIVNFSTKEYSRGQKRLEASLNGYKKLMLNSYEAINSPTHQNNPYAFKLHAIEAAWEFDPIVLWADSSFWRVGDLSKIEKLIIEDGYFMSEAGAWVGDWCNKHTRQWFNLTEEEAKVPGGMFMFSAGLLGLNRDSPIAQEFFKQWKASCNAGCFIGDYREHRHDQTAGSIIAQRMRMKFQRGGQHMSYIGPGYSQPEKDTVFYLQGL
jgi:hypothetical protein